MYAPNHTEMRIGELSARSGIPIETIRYYERIGLLPPPNRTASGYRQYDETALKQLRFIKRAQELGFTLREIKDLLTLKYQQNTAITCQTIQNRALEKLQDIEAKIADLVRMRTIILKLIEHCPSDSPVDECPILEALSQSSSHNM